MPDAATSNATRRHEMSCLEVWGGNTPADAAIRLPGLDVWVIARPCDGSEAGGDVHYLSSCGTGRITRLLVADVAGHGPDVAATADLLRGLMRRFINRIEQTDLVTQINQHFAESTPDDKFATAVVATFFAPTAELSMVNAGHPPPLVYSQKHGRWLMLTGLNLIGPDDRLAGDGAAAMPAGVNMPLGILESEDYTDRKVRLDPDDLLLFYTDSLPESRDHRTGQMLGFQGLLNLVAELDHTQPEQMLPALVERIVERNSQRVCEDDLTVLLMRVTRHRGGAPLGQKVSAAGRFVWDLLRGKWWPIPWPEWDLRNVGGAMVPPLSRVPPKRGLPPGPL
jgi:hypothetical protein